MKQLRPFVSMRCPVNIIIVCVYFPNYGNESCASMRLLVRSHANAYAYRMDRLPDGPMLPCYLAQESTDILRELASMPLPQMAAAKESAIREFFTGMHVAPWAIGLSSLYFK